MEVIHLPYLDGLQVKMVKGEAMGRSTGIVIDWSDGFSRHPEMHKPLHLLLMDSGLISLQPNNYLRWHDPSFVVKGTWEKTRSYRRGDALWYPEDDT